MDVLNAEIDRLRLEVHNLKGESGAQNISIGNYLLARLEQLGVKVLKMNSFVQEVYYPSYFSLCLVFREISTWNFWFV